MKYHFSVTGIGFCVGNIADHEDLVEAITTRKKPAKRRPEPTARYAINAALKYKDEKPVMLISNMEVSQDILEKFRIGQQQTIGRFAQMLQGAAQVFTEGRYDNVLLLGQSADGYAAVLLSGHPERCFAQVSIDARDASAPEEPLVDAMMRFITAVVEIRYAFKLDGSVKDGSYIWHWAQKRALDRTIDGVAVSMKEAELVNKAVFASKRYIFPVMFDTVEEAKVNLRSLQSDASRLGLYKAMRRRTADLNAGKRAENIIVILAENYDSLKQQTDELLAKSGQLLNEGFRWKSAAGSLYIRKTTRTPKIVFMNPPGGMFNSQPFHRYVSKLYDFVDGPFQPGRSIFSGRSPNETLDRYLQEINITFVVMYLLEAIGIRPDYLSGASMGEVVFDVIHIATGNGGESGAEDMQGAATLEVNIRNVLDGQKEHEKAYFGREVDLAKYYLKCGAEAAKQAIAKYDDVFVIIEGSPKDVLICGERASCGKLIQELGCIAIELGDPMYVHTPVLESQFEVLRKNVVDAGLHLDVDGLPYRLFSTYLKKDMDSSSEMLAENYAAIITRPVNYTEAVNALYDRDARVFIDLSTTQLCGNWAKNTLSRHPDAEVVSIYECKDTGDYLTDLCAVMLAGNVSFDFDKMYSKLTFVNDAPVEKAPVPVVTKPVPVEKKTKEPAKAVHKQEVKAVVNVTAPQTADTQQALRQYIANQMALNQKAYEMYLDAQDKLFGQIMAAQAGAKPAQAPAAAVNAPKKDYLWDREQVIEMTDRSMAAVLGEQYREVDQYPVRARMPLPPFLFVSRIISIDAEFGKLRPSSIVAEYDLDEDCVFRTGDTYVSPLIASEASHIGIFLIAYMGLDAMSKGTLSYRATDSTQVTYSERPFRVGDTMRTELKITKFIQNGSTVLLFFTFKTYIEGELISVTDAAGGFFTKEELASNKGIITPKINLKKQAPREFLHFSNFTRTSYSEEQVSAFYRGDYEACFGGSKTKPSLKEAYYLPHDLKMVDRVTEIDYNGGMYGRGIICGEKQITPDMWPFKAHFKNDPVFPAIIMTDGVGQLGVFLFAYAGLLSRFENTGFTLVKGNCVKSRFRGQVRQGYSTLRYEVHVKDVVCTEESIAVYFDAGIFNDGLQVIQVENYSLKIVRDLN